MDVFLELTAEYIHWMYIFKQPLHYMWTCEFLFSDRINFKQIL